MPNVRTRHGIRETWSAHNSWENRLPIDLCWWFICCVLVCPSETVSFIISPALILHCLCDYMTHRIILNPLVCFVFLFYQPPITGITFNNFFSLKRMHRCRTVFGEGAQTSKIITVIDGKTTHRIRCPLVKAVWHRFVCVCLKKSYEKKSTSHASSL